MAKLVRKTLLQFGSTANSGSEIGQYGSFAAPIYSNDTDVLQAGTAWPRGWIAETIATNRPFLEDFNAIDYVFGYMLCYILQQGIPEYDAATTYYINSICQTGGVTYISLTDANVGNTPASSPANWKVAYVDSTSNQTVGGIKTFSSVPVMPATFPILSVGLPSSTSITNEVETVIPYSVKNIDTNVTYNTGTYRYTPNIPGYYKVYNQCTLSTSGSSGCYLQSLIYKNAVRQPAGVNICGALVGTNNFLTALTETIVYMNGTTDYLSFSVTGKDASTTSFSLSALNSQAGCNLIQRM